MFQEFIRRYWSELDGAMRRVVSSVDDSTPGFSVMLRYAMGWSTETGDPYNQQTGKRIRPLLLLLCTETTDGNWSDALPAAAAVELLHNFSLIHDDIQDNSPLRHGRPAVWKIWGTANAINAGDALFGLSYKALEGLSSNLSPEIILKALQIFNATVLELTRGQHLDMRFESQPVVAVDDYVSMISGKSAALISACAQMGALIGSKDTTTAQRFGEFGLNIGIAFQIRDDILGIWGDPNETGKSVSTDIVSRKKSLPVLYGLSQSEALAQVYQRENFTDSDVNEAVNLLDSVNALDYARGQETLYYEQALDALSDVANTNESLKTFVDVLFNRTY